MAIHQAPGVLAVKVEYPSGLATIGTERNRPVPLEEIVASLKLIGYRGKLVEETNAGKN